MKIRKEKTYGEKRAFNRYITSVICICLIGFYMLSYHIHTINSEQIEGTLVEIVYSTKKSKRGSKINYYGIYNYYDKNLDIQKIKSNNPYPSEDTVPKTVTIYYNTKTNKAKVEMESTSIALFVLSMLIFLPCIPIPFIKTKSLKLKDFYTFLKKLKI